jgi:hypothetical protein
VAGVVELVAGLLLPPHEPSAKATSSAAAMRVVRNVIRER